MKSKDNLRQIVILALNNLKGVGPSYIKKIKPELFAEDVFASLRSILGEEKRYSYDELALAVDAAQETLSVCRDESISVLDIFSEYFPSSLKALRDSPCLIFYRGNINLLYEKIVCIIGTREPNENAAKISERLGQYFSSLGIPICNGLAEGVDRFAISTHDDVYAKTIGVLAGGLNFNSKKTVNKTSAQLSEKVLNAGGIVVSEQIPGKREDTFSIVKSCRIQAGLSSGLILVQSSLSGGSKYTVKAFCEMIRPLAVIQPIAIDQDHPAYEANIAIINNYTSGIAKFTKLSPQKIGTKNFLAIKSKDDYGRFLQMLVDSSGHQSRSQGSLTLFD